MIIDIGLHYHKHNYSAFVHEQQLIYLKSDHTYMHPTILQHPLPHIPAAPSQTLSPTARSNTNPSTSEAGVDAPAEDPDI
jgi:hypothetical protein